MARPAATYRGARCASAHANKTPMQKLTTEVISIDEDGVKTCRVVPLPEPRTIPYFCKKPRTKFGTFQVGPVPSAAADVTVPYTDLRKQPRVYRS